MALIGQTSLAQVDPGNGGRQLADGVLHVIPSALNARDTFSLPAPMAGIEAKAWQPKLLSDKETLHGLSRRVVFFRDVWEYEFAFTGLRQAKIELENVGTQNVWYMVYRVRNLGTSLTFEDVKKNPEFEHLSKDLRRNQPVERKSFRPRLTLEGWVFDDLKNKYSKVVYRDEINPILAMEIQRREDINLPLFDSATLTTAAIQQSKPEQGGGVWGVAIWSDVNPKLDFVSVFAKGFTNAFRIVRDGDKITKKHKTIQLNFWRPGDAINQSDDEIDFGIPLVEDPQQQVLITRRYNLPGPLFKVTEDDPKANRDVLRAEIDAMADMRDFASPLVPILDKGRLPAKLVQELTDVGIKVTEGTAIEALTQGKKWFFLIDGKTYYISLEHQFWEPKDKGIRFIRSLDSFWIYR